MNNPMTFAAFRKQVKKLFVIWLVLALVVALVVTGIHFTSLSARTTASATVNFGFSGIEKGQDPNGNWFDVTKMKDPDIIEAAAEAAGITLAEGDAEQIAAHLYIEGYVPETAVDEITNLTSTYTEEGLSASSTQQATAYFPTMYTLRLNFEPMGYTVEQGNALLQGVLDAYPKKFYATYGYNAALEKQLAEEDYESYDYNTAVSVLDGNLEILQRYIESMAAGDTTGFRSEATGLTFQDLLSVVQTLRNQDVKQMASYIASNNVSRDLELQKNTYAYGIEQGLREVTGLQDRINSITEIIDKYTKTRSVVMGASTINTADAGSAAVTGTATATATGEEDPATDAESGSGSFSTAYEVTQHSDMYDKLIRRRVDLRTEMAEVNGRVARYGSLLANLELGSTEEARAVVEERFANALVSMNQLLENVRNTAEEYFNRNKLADAFRVISFSGAASFPVRRLLNVARLDILAAEAVLLGIFILLAVYMAGRDGKDNNGRRKTRTAEQKA